MFNLKNLGNGLILRCLEESDKDSLLEHVKTVYTDNPDGVGLLTLQLLENYPGLTLQDNFVVVDTKREIKIIAWLCLLRKKCILEGIEIPYGQMEMVGVQKEYRNRGLIRQLNNVYEERTHEYDIPFLVILGIPYFYKTFRYEYALELEPYLSIFTEQIISLKEKEEEGFSLHQVCDLTNFMIYIQFRNKRNTYLDLYQEIEESVFDFYNKYKLGETNESRQFYLVFKNGLVIGNFYLVIRFGSLRIRELYLEKMDALPTIIHFSKKIAKQNNLSLSVLRPAQDELIPYIEQITGSKFVNPYAWYVKFPSILRFLEYLTPVLEKRLKNSIYSNLDIIIKINYYKAGIELSFQNGKLSSIKEIKKSELQSGNHSYDLFIPPNRLIQLFMGYKIIDELESSALDVSCDGRKKYLLNTIFPSVKASLTPIM